MSIGEIIVAITALVGALTGVGALLLQLKKGGAEVAKTEAETEAINDEIEARLREQLIRSDQRDVEQRDRIGAQSEQIRALCERVDNLEQADQELRAENAVLRTEVAELRAENDILREENDRFRARIEVMQRDIDRFVAENSALRNLVNEDQLNKARASGVFDC